MAHLLNKNTLLTLVSVFATLILGAQTQEEEITPAYKDYKKNEDFYKFHKRAKTIGAWQINELKEGALVVRLKTNKVLIDALLANGDKELAEEKQAEQFVINKNIMKAYLDNFTFCKLYFINSNSSDSLQKGLLSGIFLDTNLVPDPQITMKEKYYLIAERGYAYNSSIGFVKQDSARFVKETGSPVREMGVVIKNKYGHQLKSPFPYYVKDKTFVDYAEPVAVKNVLINNVQTRVFVNAIADRKSNVGIAPVKNEVTIVKVKKQDTYAKVAIVVQQLNDELSLYYKSSPKPEYKRLNPLILPYLY